jgi:hypothetical protein
VLPLAPALPPPPPPERPLPFFRYWVDSQALSSAASTVLLERALVALGGRRTGGPPKRGDEQEEQEEEDGGGEGAMRRHTRRALQQQQSSRALMALTHPQPPRLYGYMRMGDWDFLWSITAKAMLAAELLRPGQLVSVVPGCLSVSRKTSLVRSLCSSYGRGVAFAVVPLTFKLPEEMGAWARELGREQEQAAEAAAAEAEQKGGRRRPLQQHPPPCWWMLKNNKQRGTGLRLVRGGDGQGDGQGQGGGGAAAALRAALETSTRATGQHAGLPLYRWYLAQRYVSDPLLLRPYGGSDDWIRGPGVEQRQQGGAARSSTPPPPPAPLDNSPRKFGLRLWALVPSAAPPFRAYIHQRGLALFSSRAYTSDPWEADQEEEGQQQQQHQEGSGGGGRPPPLHQRPPVPEGHLTNAARNAGAPVWPLRRVAEVLGPLAWRELWEALCRSSALALAASARRVRDLRSEIALPPGGAFQLFGLDFVVDASLKPWLLEVNATPSMRVDHPCAVSRAVVEGEKWPAVWDAMMLLGVGPERFSGGGAAGEQRARGGGGRRRGLLSWPFGRRKGGGGVGRDSEDEEEEEEAGSNDGPRRRRTTSRSSPAADRPEATLAGVREEMGRAGGYCPLTHLFPDAETLPGCTVPWTRADDALRRWLVAEQRRRGGGGAWHEWRGSEAAA